MPKYKKSSKIKGIKKVVKVNAKPQSIGHRYVVQTYCSWTEPQFATEILDSLEQVNQLASFVDEIEAVYLLGKEIPYQDPYKLPASEEESSDDEREVLNELESLHGKRLLQLL